MTSSMLISNYMHRVQHRRHSPKYCNPVSAHGCRDLIEPGSYDDTNDWVNIAVPDPTHGFEQVENLDFKQLQNSLDELETSVRLLERASDVAFPQYTHEHMPLRPSVYERLRRSGPNVAVISHRNAQYTKQIAQDPPRVVEIIVKHESESGQMKLTIAGRRHEPVTIAKVKEVMVAELGAGTTSEFGFILKSGNITALRLDYEDIRPPRKKRRFELVVRGIELPKPKEHQFQPKSFNLRAQYFRAQDTSTFELRPPGIPSTFSMAPEAEYFILTPPPTPGRALSLRDIDFSEVDENEWSML
mmetsp:Transcript_72379/g.125486  ORF Transcript_72379/g.125486 Transcript_72379/m.125486 type:complete len:301 (+) Transcript_72379:102-1004(+)